eukprot:scpid19464/ scgid4041/ E3 ubiquitin-protein ligase NRDP1; RING finger protein 41 &gt; E3 ubiquitin-protein ligase NRDP1; RING finger protein 41
MSSTLDHAFHVEHVNSLCRLGGCKLPTNRKGHKSWSATTYTVKEHSLDIFRAFNVKVEEDQEGVHPNQFCKSCFDFLHSTLIRKKGSCNAGGCGQSLPTVHEWSAHTDSKCSTCTRIAESRKGGRQKKATKTIRGARMTHGDSDVSTCTNAVDIDQEKVAALVTDNYVSCLPLSPDRFTFVPSALICHICGLVANRAVQSPCCSKLVCAECIVGWLETSSSCHSCKKVVLLSSYQSVHPFARVTLSELVLSCDNAGESALEGYSARVTLASLQSHVAECPFAKHPPPKRYLTPSSTVASVLAAPHGLLQGDVASKLLNRLVEARAEDGRLEQRTRGSTSLWHRVPVARVSSSDASSSTLRRRESLLDGIQQAACGGAKGKEAQSVHALQSLRRSQREDLLREAGLLPEGLQKGIGLAIKSDLQLPWNGLRKLRRYLRLCGLSLESEREMRKQLSEELPFPLVAKEVPLLDSSGTVIMSPVVCFDNLVELVLHFVELNEEAGTLVWEGACPEDELWVKIGGDHGGHSFKLCFQLVNVLHPNSLSNTVPFLVFAAKDSPSNLATAFQPYAEQVDRLRSCSWKGKKIKVCLFGDYDFMMKLYGLSGASGVRPCLFCLATKKDMQPSPDTLFPDRTLDMLKEDLGRFVESGSRLQNAKQFNNVIRPQILPIELDDVCVPILHLDLGIFPLLFEAMVRDAEEIDLMLARESTDTSSSSTFNDAAKMQRELWVLLAEKAQQEQQLYVARTQLQWAVLNAAQAMQANHVAEAQHAGLAAQLQQHWAAQQQQLNDMNVRISSLEERLVNAKVKNGPCASSFEPVLVKHRIDRQAYHSGAFVGNHINKALQPSVTQQIVSAPLTVVASFVNPDGASFAPTQAQHQLLKAAEECSARYASLFGKYASCRAIFASTITADDDMVKSLEEKIVSFMANVRSEVVVRHKRPVTPKLHLLECHLVPCVKRFGMALGALGEQGGESIHHKFNLLRATLQNTNKDVDRLRTLVAQYLTTALPTHNKLIVPAAKRKKTS